MENYCYFTSISNYYILLKIRASPTYRSNWRGASGRRANFLYWVAALANPAIAAATFLVTASQPGVARRTATKCTGSFQPKNTSPLASCQTRALCGKSIPTVWGHSSIGVPPGGEPQMSTSVSRKALPMQAFELLFRLLSAKFRTNHNLAKSAPGLILSLCPNLQIP